MKEKPNVTITSRTVHKVTTSKKINNSKILFPGQKTPPVTVTTVKDHNATFDSTSGSSASRATNTNATASGRSTRTTATAMAIARDTSHPKREEVSELLKALQRGH